MARCRKPPTLAFAYISPARSSKRRMSIIVSSHSRAVSGSGTPAPVSCCVTSATPRTLARLVPPPAPQKLVGVEPRQVGLQRAGEAPGLLRRRVPEQHDLAGLDLHDLDVIGLAG